MKTLHKLMFGCLALMVAMSMLFVSCSDDDNDDDDNVVKKTQIVGTSDTETNLGIDAGDTVTFILLDKSNFEFTNHWTNNYKGVKGTYTVDSSNANKITCTPTSRVKKATDATWSDDILSDSDKWEAATCYTSSESAAKSFTIDDINNLSKADWKKLNNVAAYAYLDAIAVLAKAGDAADTFVAPTAATGDATYTATTVAAGGVLRLVVCKSEDCFGKLETGTVSYKVTGGGTIATTAAKYGSGDDAPDISSFTDIDGVSLAVEGNASPWSVGTVNDSFGVVKYTAPTGSIPEGGITIEATYVNKVNGATATGTIKITDSSAS